METSREMKAEDSLLQREAVSEAEAMAEAVIRNPSPIIYRPAA